MEGVGVTGRKGKRQRRKRKKKVGRESLPQTKIYHYTTDEYW